MVGAAGCPLVALGRQLRDAQDGAGGAEDREGLVDVPGLVLELDHERDVAWPRRQERGQPLIGEANISSDPWAIPANLAWNPVQHGTEAVAELREGLREPGHAF